MDMTFFHIHLLQKLFCFFEKTKNKWKRDRGWHIFFKKWRRKEENKQLKRPKKIQSRFFALSSPAREWLFMHRLKTSWTLLVQSNLSFLNTFCTFCFHTFRQEGGGNLRPSFARQNLFSRFRYNWTISWFRQILSSVKWVVVVRSSVTWC